MNVINTDVFVNNIRMARQEQTQKQQQQSSPSSSVEEKKKYFNTIAWDIIQTMTKDMKDNKLLEYTCPFKVTQIYWFYTLFDMKNQELLLNSIRERLVGDAKIEVEFTFLCLESSLSNTKHVVDNFNITFKIV